MLSISPQVVIRMALEAALALGVGLISPFHYKDICITITITFTWGK